MVDSAASTRTSGRFSFAVNFLVVLGSFCLYTMISWPIFLSFDLWMLEDRASFLHLDELLAAHYRLGVDIFYSYGLLPVLLQHLVFLAFGRSFKPMLACTLLVLVINAVFWAALLKHLPPQRRWLVSVAALSPIILIVNPNWPYSLAVLSIMFALLLVLEDRLDVALAVSVIGCFCVPSLTLVLTMLITLLIVTNWWIASDKNISRLAALLAPGLLTYAGLAFFLGSVYGFASLAATALPLNGARFYKEAGYSGFSAFLAFVCPAGYGLKYYIALYTGTHVTWFLLCSIFLFALSLYSLRPLLKGFRLAPPANFVVLYSIIQFTFIFFVYGPRGQHVLYEGIIAAATLVGISILSHPRHRKIALTVFLAVGILGEIGPVYKTLSAWHTTVRSPELFGLYAERGLAKELREIVALSRSRKTLVLGYATGLHNYYPSLEVPNAWFLQRGQLFPAQKLAIVDQINQADVVVEVLASPSPVVDNDVNIQAALKAMPKSRPENFFLIHSR